MSRQAYRPPFFKNPHDREVYVTEKWIELKILTTVRINQK
jgi:hypothetical protein